MRPGDGAHGMVDEERSMFAEAVTSSSAPASASWRPGSGNSMSKQMSGAARRPASSRIISSSPWKPASASGGNRYVLR